MLDMDSGTSEASRMGWYTASRRVRLTMRLYRHPQNSRMLVEANGAFMPGRRAPSRGAAAPLGLSSSTQTISPTCSAARTRQG